MLIANVDQQKHIVADIIKSKKSSQATIDIFESFINRVNDIFMKQQKKVLFRAHKHGVTAFCDEKKAFMFINLCRNHIAIVFYSGTGKIPGLAKANWSQKNDNKGSETFIVKYEDSLAIALNYAQAAWTLRAGS